MTIRLVHCSDTHGQPSIVKDAAQMDVDLILLTGDCIQNKGRFHSSEGFRIDFVREIKYQQSWYRKQAKEWAKAAGGKPFITVRGNHDFIEYGEWLRHYGAEVYEITDKNPCIELLGKKWAGFRQIPYIDGEWAGEEADLAPFVEKTLACDPDVLVTHVPPGGILDLHGALSYGSPELMSALTYRKHRITHHFFGHMHQNGGQTLNEMGIYFANGACGSAVHVIP